MNFGDDRFLCHPVETKGSKTKRKRGQGGREGEVDGEGRRKGKLKRENEKDMKREPKGPYL